jgi:hypothetical protein
MRSEGPLFAEPLILIGYWAGGSGNERWPDVREFVDEDWADEDRIQVGLYLGNGLVARAWMGYSTCRFCGASNGDLDLTDGVYLWPQGLAHYVREHHVRLPDEFTEHVRRRVGLVDGITVDEAWWRDATPGEVAHR